MTTHNSFLEFFSILTAILLFFVSFGYVGTSAQVNASSSFGSCPNPGGSQIASYSNGWHWLVGNGQLQWGSDTVYSHGNNTYTQCFCPLTSNNQPTGAIGTQTNWLFGANVSGQTRQFLLNNGWVSVADGSAFGLSSGEFLAQNSSFACNNPSASSFIHISQNNNTNISNTIHSSVNTGGNKANFNTNETTITTGNSSSMVNITNRTNMNSLHIIQQQLSHMQMQILQNGSFSSNSIFINQ